ncbi:MAG: Stp1/IreP family PP2C-type Ser/Thr phosphatase [Clostridia bacterium]|nr:Stp1/IreP family PP2C-type Ser/Thr phosphatase [Clostridia bacterium]
MLDFYGATDKGVKRIENQDSFYVAKKAPYVFIVCDGMGGHAAGNVASSSAAESVYKYVSMHSSFDMTDQKAELLLGGAMEYANNIVHSRSLLSSKYAGMGTTADVCFLNVDTLYISHVGDSRVYLMREGELIRLTEDHTLVNKLLREGEITEKQAEKHPDRHMLTQALGTEEKIEYDFIKQQICEGDIILMCTDGLTNMVSEDTIKVLLISGSAEQAVNQLIEKANKNGGADNVTAVVIKF